MTNEALVIGSHVAGVPRFGEGCHVIDLCRYLQYEGWSVLRAGLDPFDMRYSVAQSVVPLPPPREDERGVSVVSMPGDFISRLGRLNEALHADLVASIAKTVDVIHLHTELAAPAAFALANTMQVPVIYTPHIVNQVLVGRTYPDSIIYPFLCALQEFSMTHAQAVVAPSLDTKATVEKLSPGAAVTVIPHPVLATRTKEDYVVDGPAKLLFVGRLAPIKGLALVLPAIADLDVPVELWVIGEGHDEDRLQMRCDQLGISAVFFGQLPREQLLDTYADADVFLMPSIVETYGLTLSEAMASGLPCVAHALPCISERVSDGRTGILICPPQDDELDRRLSEHWRSALNRVLRSESLRRSLGTAARTIQTTGWARYGELYKKVRL